jgi:hypothetical protein
MKTGLASIAIRTRVRRRGKKSGLAMHSRWDFSTLDRKVETHPSRANRPYTGAFAMDHGPQTHHTHHTHHAHITPHTPASHHTPNTAVSAPGPEATRLGRWYCREGAADSAPCSRWRRMLYCPTPYARLWRMLYCTLQYSLPTWQWN